MGLLDTVKGLVKGREKQVKSGIDAVSNQVEKRVGAKHAGKVDDLSHKAKDAVDKLGGTGAPAPSTPAAPPAAVTPPPAPETPATPPPAPPT